MITKAFLLSQTRRLWEEAFAADGDRTMASTVAVVGRAVWVWDALTVPQLRALRRAVYPTVLETRG